MFEHGVLKLDCRLKKEIRENCDSNDGNLFNSVFIKKIESDDFIEEKVYGEISLVVILVQCVLRKACYHQWQ